MKLRELVDFDVELKREVEVYAKIENIVLDQLLELSVSEWLKLLVDKLGKIVEAQENV